MSGEPVERLKIFSNPRNRLRHPFFTNWTTVDKVVLMLTVTFFIVTLNVDASQWWLVASIMSLFLNVRLEYARAATEIASIIEDAYIKIVLRGTLYDADDESNALVQFLRQKRYRRSGNRYIIPIRVRPVVTLDENGKDVGGLTYLEQVDRPFVHVPIGSSGSDFSSFDQGRQHDTTLVLAERTNAVMSRTKLKAGVAYVDLARPFNTYNTERYFATNGQSVFLSDKFDLDETEAQVRQNMQQTFREITQSQRVNGVTDVWANAVVNIKRTGELQKATKSQLSADQLMNLRIFKFAREMADAINSAGMTIRNLHLMDYHEVCRLIRATWDVKNLDFHDLSKQNISDLASGPTPEAGEDSEEQVKLPFSIFPTKKISVGSDFLCMDDNWITTFRVTRKPEQFDITNIQSLFHGNHKLGVWSSAATVGETISGQSELNTMEWKESAEANWSGVRNRNRIIPDSRADKRKKALRDQTNEFAENSLAQQFNDVFSIVAPSYEKAVADRKEYMAQLENKNFKCSVIVGASRQIDAWITATLFNRL